MLERLNLYEESKKTQVFFREEIELWQWVFDWKEVGKHEKRRKGVDGVFIEDDWYVKEMPLEFIHFFSFIIKHEKEKKRKNIMYYSLTRF